MLTDFDQRQAFWRNRERQLIPMQRAYLGFSCLRGLLERRYLCRGLRIDCGVFRGLLREHSRYDSKSERE